MVMTNKVVFCHKHVRHSVIMDAVEQLKWNTTDKENIADIVWLEKILSVEELTSLIQNTKVKIQKYSRFVGMKRAVSKYSFSLLMNRMVKYFPEEYSFYPVTYLVPDEYVVY
jgi:hypothetical protein